MIWLRFYLSPSAACPVLCWQWSSSSSSSSSCTTTALWYWATGTASVRLSRHWATAANALFSSPPSPSPSPSRWCSCHCLFGSTAGAQWAASCRDTVWFYTRFRSSGMEFGIISTNRFGSSSPSGLSGIGMGTGVCSTDFSPCDLEFGISCLKRFCFWGRTSAGRHWRRFSSSSTRQWLPVSLWLAVQC